MLTIREFSKVCGVSKATVSLAFRKDSHLPGATRQRILTLAEQHGYLPNRAVRSIRSKRTHTVAIIVDTCKRPGRGAFVQGCQEALAERGLSVLVYHTKWQAEAEDRAIRLALEYRVDGIIIMPMWFVADAPSAQLLRTCRVPHVARRTAAAALEEDLVTIDIDQEARLGVEHLVGLGHRRIGVASWAPTPPGEYPRLSRVREALAARELALPKRRVAMLPPGLANRSGAREQVGELLRRCPEATALVCLSSPMSLGALDAARNLSLRVPEDLSLVSMCAAAEVEQTDLAFTCVTYSEEAVGQAAAKLLLERIENQPAVAGHEQSDGYRAEVLPVTFRQGLTTAPPREREE